MTSLTIEFSLFCIFRGGMGKERKGEEANHQPGKYGFHKLGIIGEKGVQGKKKKRRNPRKGDSSIRYFLVFSRRSAAFSLISVRLCCILLHPYQRA